MKVNGIILINKERGISSNNVVNKVKHLLNADKAGHLGTLDVLGEGLLPVTLGKGTKLFDYFLNKDKVYKTVFKFGYTTTTLDLEGEVTDSNDKEINIDDLKKTIIKFIGKQNQMPPIYSAKKINGKKAYELARQGIQNIELKPKEIEIYSIDITNQVDYNTFEFIVHCSSGTYIRSLCRDIASSLSTFGVMLSIQRTRCGCFSIEDSFTLSDVKNGNYKILNLDTVFDYEKMYLIESQYNKLLNGEKIVFNAGDGLYRTYFNQDFLGITEIKDNYMKFYLRLI